LRKAVVPLALLAAGCGGASAAGDNVIQGAIRYSGGPEGMVNEGPQPGKVKLLLHGDEVASQEIEEGERFRFKVRAGDYTLRTDLGDLPCTRNVHVAQPVVEANLDCSIK
jgi:hypothetical protein